MSELLSVYHHLPYALKVIVASARGYYLRWWRYSSEAEELVASALERENWSPKQWHIWQEERLALLLHRAATQVPYYQTLWSRRRRQGDHRSWEILENWPVLTKHDLSANPLAFVAKDCDPNRMFRDHTSGTTGTSLTIYQSRNTVRSLYAIFEARNRRWFGVSKDEHWAILGGQLVAPFEQSNPPFWVYNAGLNQLYLSTHHLSPQNARFYSQALMHFDPTHMIVYPSSAAVLAQAVLEQKLQVPSMKVILSNAEFLLDQQRKSIVSAFNTQVRNTYGMGEAVAAATECEQGSLHLWPEMGLVEVFDYDQDRPAKNTEGRFILTGLLNLDMPLIRYEIGDTGQLASPDFRCPCGRSLPVISRIEGRTNDLLVTRDGRRVFWVNPVFYDQPVKEGQIIQENLEQVRLRFVPTEDYTPQAGESMTEHLRQRMGAVKVILEPVAKVPREANGKFRAVVSLVNLVEPDGSKQIQEIDFHKQ
jgi:phenylacetate-CoA ligase